VRIFSHRFRVCRSFASHPDDREKVVLPSLILWMPQDMGLGVHGMRIAAGWWHWSISLYVLWAKVEPTDEQAGKEGV
jgi:hypothetical protein